MKPLLLGEAPSKTGDPEWQTPLKGLNSRRLCEWAGLPHDGDGYDALTASFDVRNLLARYPGPSWQEAGEEARDALLPELEGRVVVLLGVRLARLFWRGPRHVWEVTSFRARMAWVYHPSGRTRQYNDPGERAATGAILREAIQKSSRPLRLADVTAPFDDALCRRIVELMARADRTDERYIPGLPPASPGLEDR